MAKRLRRFPHLLAPNRACERAEQWVFYDCESALSTLDGGTVRHTLRLGWAVYVRLRPGGKRSESWIEFKTPSELWAWVDGKIRGKSKAVMVSHNQHFDFLVSAGSIYLPELGWTVRKMILDSDAFIVKWRNGSRTLLCLDSVNVFRMSLRTLAESVGLSKGNVDFLTATDAEVSGYCRLDVEILKQAYLKWVSFVQEKDLGNLQATAPAQAFQAYRHRFMPCPVAIHCHKTALDLEREAYRGGRTEALRLGKIDGPIYELDFNSLYPYVMRASKYPTKLSRVVLRCSVEDLEAYLEDSAVIARVKVEVSRPIVGVREHKLIFPIGRFQAVLTGPELEAVGREGRILSVSQVALYEQEDLFSSYVDFFYKERLDAKARGDKTADLMAKLMMNSLYGKFGQRQVKVTPLGSCDAHRFEVIDALDAETLQAFRLRYCFGQVDKIEPGTEESFNSFPGIAAYITARARLRLWEAMSRAGLENVSYVDTDSLFVNEQGFQALQGLVDSSRLGFLKLVGVFPSMVIHGLKDYELGDVAKIKGVKEGSVQVDEGVFQEEVWRRIPGMLRKGVPNAVDVETRQKVLKRVYDKGVILPGGTVRPFILPGESFLFESSRLGGKRRLPSHAEIVQRAIELWLTDNRSESFATPEVSELREGGYLKEAQIDLMSHPCARSAFL